VSYTSILRNNRNFRLLYIGQTISQLGDWFNAVAVYALLLDLTGSATAVAWMMIVQFLPVAVFGPLAGVIVDRVNRRRLMIVTDLLRGALTLTSPRPRISSKRTRCRAPPGRRCSPWAPRSVVS
jgi:MFS family permease